VVLQAAKVLKGLEAMGFGLEVISFGMEEKTLEGFFKSICTVASVGVVLRGDHSMCWSVSA
jgi:hypothetical protein